MQEWRHWAIQRLWSERLEMGHTPLFRFDVRAIVSFFSPYLFIFKIICPEPQERGHAVQE
jgi:hypothetical protein